jgi:leucyl aminopeptidase
VRKGDRSRQLEQARRAGNAMVMKLAEAKREEALAVSLQDDPEATLALLEGATLGAYAFTRHKTTNLPRTLKKLGLVASEVTPAALQEMLDVCRSVAEVRDLVNEPASHLSAVQLGQEAQRLGKEAGFSVKVLNKKQIEAEGMGGLLAVNQGSIDPPVFIIMEWKPKGAVNKQPVVLVGKGVVYDTGGLSLKPTPNSMDAMKCDMAGAGAVIGAITAVARQKVPVHVVALVPSTDNRPGGRAFAPGDVLRMHNGLTVENLNSDAEGRLILADALSYAERFQAETIFTLATLTGAAVRAIGTYGTVTMGTAPEPQFERLEQAAGHTFERVARMPFWDEYGEELKSDIADLKNLGSALAGQITAGKFLARFTTRPLIHLDIAGPAFLDKRDHYRTKGGTGTGVRLLYAFIKRRAAAK